MSEQNQQDDLKIVIAITIYAILASLLNEAFIFNEHLLQSCPIGFACRLSSRAWKAIQ